MDAIEIINLEDLIETIDPVLGAMLKVGEDAASQAIASVAVQPDDGLFTAANADVLLYAEARSAELVGKRIVDGKIVDNPNPKWAITEATRDMLRQDVRAAFSEGTADKLAQQIQNSYAFSHARSVMIARTEGINALARGALAGYQAAKDAGVPIKKSWLTAEDEKTCPVCMGNELVGPIELDEEFPSGDLAPSAHPHCRCALVPVVES